MSLGQSQKSTASKFMALASRLIYLENLNKIRKLSTVSVQAVYIWEEKPLMVSWILIHKSSSGRTY